MKKLAIFLGANVVEEKTLNPLIRKWNSPHFKPLDGKFQSGHELKFNTDWNWIMPVVHKLYRFRVDNADTISHEHKNLFAMLIDDILDGISKNDINRVCNDCIELVKYIEIHKIKF
ncbi:hypothetical protein [Flavobacterium sp.]|uniref:hypothetical protein n=1 Tax=Flavobacterium sp. TaxID=239 RepID=UPI00262C1FC7|nr:hypothetical protein [Flavobacterium sp.]